MQLLSNHSLTIDAQYLKFKTARSSGPGGQHVNKVSTAVTLCFDVAGCTDLTTTQKRVLRRKLRSRISKSDILRVTSRKFRSQAANKKAVLKRFGELLSDALKPAKRRIATKTPRSAIERRIDQKKHRSRLKHQRHRPTRED